MIRNSLIFLAGVVVTLAALFVLSRFPTGQSWLLNTIRLSPYPVGPGPRSNIRVVGGSVEVHLKGGYSWSTDSKNKLEVQNADALSFAIENVSTSNTGNPVTISYAATAGQDWSIEIPTDPIDGTRGVKVKGSPGSTTTNGMVTFVTRNNGDQFTKKFMSKNRRYKNTSNDCPADQDACERVRQIQLTWQGVVTTLYCVDPNHKCHVDIGSEP